MAAILPLLILLSFISASMAEQCNPRNTSFAGFESDLAMVQHQLRGIVRIVDGCSFSVRAFDMLPASPAARWWAAGGTDLHNLTTGSPVSDFALNRTFSNETLTLSLKNVSWDQISVLAVWDPATFSDLGHVLLPSVPPDLSPPPSSSPSPSPVPAPGGSMNRAYSHPTMFDNCRVISPKYRLRWTLYPDSNSIEIGLEATVASQFYMAFGWASADSSSPSMINSDIAIARFTEEGNPFADDYFITQYSECLLSKDGRVEGVCPDTIYAGSDSVGLVNNTELVYGHRRDGVSFIRYSRPLESSDKKYDVAVNLTQNMTVIWALGLIRPPDSLRPYYLPQNHGGPRYESFGYFTLNVSEKMDDCHGPLDAEDKEDQELISADGKIKTPLVVTSGPALHYPNPPNPSKVLYINKKEAPVLRVERGVPVKFSIQAGHDVALYITSDSIGGNATTRNMPEVIYAGGPEAEGVPATPAELLWVPDRNTPDQVYYQSLFEPKMGWRVEVVDGGLTDMYNSSVLLDDQQVTLFWTMGKDSISVAARGEKKSGYLAIGFGSGMVNSFVYVGWVDESGKGHVNTYWIDGKDAMSIHQTSENLTYVRCKTENGIITFEFTRPLSPSCTGRKECKNIIDPTTPLKVIWAMGAQWSQDNLSERNMHSVTSTRPVRVLLMRGSAEAEQDLRPVLAVHGFMMFVAWGIFLPGGILAARYLKHVKGDGWFQLHVYMQYSGIAIIFLGILFAAAELRGFFLSSLHVKFGVTATALAFAQPVNAYLRPKGPTNGEIPTSKRVIWEYSHFITGRCAIIAGIAALFTGMKHLGSRYGSENVDGLTWALMLWVLIGALLVMCLEYWKVKRSRDGNSFRGSWVLGNDEEDDSVDLLHPDRTRVESDPNLSGRMEVQLEPLNR